MLLETNQKWKLYKYLIRQKRIFINFESSLNPNLNQNDLRDKNSELNGIYQDLLEGLKPYKGQAYNQLRSFFNPNAILSYEFIVQKTNKLKTLLNSFGKEVGINLVSYENSKIKGLYYFIVESYTKIFSFGAIIFFIISSLVSIFSFDLREVFINKLKHFQIINLDIKE